MRERLAEALRVLPGGIAGAILPDMEHHAAQIENARATAERKGALHPFQAWLYDRQEAPQTLGDVARELDLPSEQVPRTWTRAKSPNRIHARVAAEIARRWGYEATPENWPNGIRG